MLGIDWTGDRHLGPTKVRRAQTGLRGGPYPAGCFTLKRHRKGLQWHSPRSGVYETIWPAVHCTIHTPMDGTHVTLAR